MTSVLKGPLSGPSHREVAGVEFGGRSGNASHNFQPGFKIWDSQDQRRQIGRAHV